MEDNNEEREKRQSVYGWENAAEVAEEMWRQGNLKLLSGNLIFAFRSLTGSSKMYQIVITQNLFPGTQTPDGTFGVSTVNSGYSAMLPKVPIEYIEGEVVDDLVSYKIDKRILEAFKSIISDIKNNKIK